MQKWTITESYETCGKSQKSHKEEMINFGNILNNSIDVWMIYTLWGKVHQFLLVLQSLTRDHGIDGYLPIAIVSFLVSVQTWL